MILRLQVVAGEAALRGSNLTAVPSPSGAVRGAVRRVGLQAFEEKVGGTGVGGCQEGPAIPEEVRLLEP